MHIVGHVFKDSNGGGVGCFDDLTAAKDHFNRGDPIACHIVYEFFPLKDSVIYYRLYNSHPYYD